DHGKAFLGASATQAEAQAFLASLGKEQRRTGDTSDDAIVVEQEPELTIYAAKEKEIETMGVPKEKVYAVTLDPEGSPWTVRYFRKITGLDHKPIGTMKVHFTFEGMPMITFEGDSLLAADLYPERQFEQQSIKGDMAITNMSRPQRGLIGIRLEESEEFGPTGEEPHGANMLGRLIGDLDALMDGIQEGDIIYIRPATAEEAVGPRKKMGQKKKASAGKRAVNKSEEG
ncbi:MAG TPA: hypothetical protein PKZ73_02800, partial [Methanomassiliicoccales archaeon]|nr:hypothetical protein [Methanomassiliicoccales archaeon]